MYFPFITSLIFIIVIFLYMPVARYLWGNSETIFYRYISILIVALLFNVVVNIPLSLIGIKNVIKKKRILEIIFKLTPVASFPLTLLVLWLVSFLR